MNDQLYTLAYFSKNAIDDKDASALQIEIEQILKVARVSNERQGITGALLYSAGCFAQVLEGPLNAVESTFEHIQLDPRHRDVAVLQHQPIECRSFGAWSMAFAGIETNAPESALVRELLTDPNTIDARPDGLDFIKVLRDLIGRHELHKV